MYDYYIVYCRKFEPTNDENAFAKAASITFQITAKSLGIAIKQSEETFIQELGSEAVPAWELAKAERADLD